MGWTSHSERRVPSRFLLATRSGSPIRRILLLGFGAIFALWLISAYALRQRVIEADSHVAAITTEFTDGEDVLSAVREQVLLSSVVVRDAALDNRPDSVSSQREQLRAIREEVERRLQGYLPRVDSEVEREHWTRLRAELDEYWASLSPVVTGQLTGQAAQAFVRSSVIPKHELVLRVSRELRTLNQDALREQQATVAELHAAVRKRIWSTSALAVGFGLVVALVSARYIASLESWIRHQHAQEREHKRELQRLSAELEDARESERRTIARDLHDEIGQALMTIKLDLGVVERTGQVSGAPAAALEEARASTDLAIRTVRDLSQLLHPPMLDDFGLAVTLQAYVQAFSERSDVRTELVLDRMDARVPADVEVCAYRIVQEALTNVAKHAEATSCRVYLHRLPHSLLVTVEDDGKGIAARSSKQTEVPSGVGLVSVRERVSRAGGTVSIESAGRGTRLTVELPVLPVPERAEKTLRASEGSPMAVSVKS
jgi:signal transduction histidine kinase